MALRLVGLTQANRYPGNLYSEAAFNITGDAVHAGLQILCRPGAEITILAGFSYRMPTAKPLLGESFKE